ncbi:MAG TPA: site-2 protease family protein [Kofleriaceae bacterium]|nr:site-2 protease family protein [Kofleriaceae bacterium]
MSLGRDALISLGLFVTCCITTTIVGGFAFGATLMGILLCHEAGHYVVGRMHGEDVSLPYFIPMPPFLTLGTLGAVIRMRTPIRDRKKLFDVGAAGPVAGLVVAIPLLLVGLSLSDVGPIPKDSAIEGNSILYALLKYATFGRWLPGDNIDVHLHPMALAAWVGLLVTMINLMPIGQLDGGHIARAALGQSHEKWSQRLHVALPVIGASVGTAMLVVAHNAGKGWSESIKYASSGVIPWMIWTLMLGWMRRSAGEYHPAVDDEPLSGWRRAAAVGMLLLFITILTPVPWRSVL